MAASAFASGTGPRRTASDTVVASVSSPRALDHARERRRPVEPGRLEDEVVVGRDRGEAALPRGVDGLLAAARARAAPSPNCISGRWTPRSTRRCSQIPELQHNQAGASRAYLTAMSETEEMAQAEALPQADATSLVDAAHLEAEVKDMYRHVAREDEAELHFEVGRPLALHLGYPPAVLDAIPAEAIASFAGVGYHLDLAALAGGEKVLDLGSGSGTDAFCAAVQVGRVRSSGRGGFHGRAGWEGVSAS